MVHAVPRFVLLPLPAGERAGERGLPISLEEEEQVGAEPLFRPLRGHLLPEREKEAELTQFCAQSIALSIPPSTGSDAPVM